MFEGLCKGMVSLVHMPEIERQGRYMLHRHANAILWATEAIAFPEKAGNEQDTQEVMKIR